MGPKRDKNHQESWAGRLAAGECWGVLFEPGTSGEWNIVERFGMCFFPAGNGKHRETMCAYMIIYGSS